MEKHLCPKCGKQMERKVFMGGTSPIWRCKPCEYKKSNPTHIQQQELRQERERQAERDISDLVDRFASALKDKLLESELKYGWNGGWRQPGWTDDLRRDIRRHVEKGDPRDVAAYCAFAWHHGWSLSTQPAAQPERESEWSWGSRCVECGKQIPAGEEQRCLHGGYCNHHVPFALRAQLAEKEAAIEKARMDALEEAAKHIEDVSSYSGYSEVGEIHAGWLRTLAAQKKEG